MAAAHLLSLVAVFALFMAGCSGPGARSPSVDFHHVHGVGYLPESNQILVATHRGLIVGNQTDGEWSWGYAGSERYDYMGFTQDGADPRVLYSSGHPDDPRAYGGVHLGLRRSTDGGATWEQRSLKGKVDFHELSAIPGVAGGIVGVWLDKMMESRDGGLTWTNHTAPAPFVHDVAVTDHHVYVATPEGLAGGQLGNASNWTRLSDPASGRVATVLAANHNASLMLAGTGDGRTGATYRSVDAGRTWSILDTELLRDAGIPPVFAFDANNQAHVFAATVGGAVLESRDYGVTWSVLRRP